MSKEQRDGIITTIDGQKEAIRATMDNIGTLYSKSISTGRNGDNTENCVQWSVNGTLSRRRPEGCTDVVVKAGVTLEVKTGCGWLVNPWTDSKDEAQEAIDNGLKMRRAAFVAYLPRYEGPESLYEMTVNTQRNFLEILARYNLIRVKKGSNGLYGVAIQSYIPSPSFKASVTRYNAVLDGLSAAGETLDDFIRRVAGHEPHNIPGVLEW